jgi:hypothetical protein
MTLSRRKERAVADTRDMKCSTIKSPVEAAINWAYKNLGGEVWDCQPACIITDYVLAIQCFMFIAVVLYTTDYFNAQWYVLYFFAMGSTAALGGFLHHVAFKAKKVFPVKSLLPARVFGMYLQQELVDQVIDWSWRFVLGFSALTNFVLVGFAASRYLSDDSSEVTIWIAGIGYAVVAIFAFIYMKTSFMLLGFVPAMLFSGTTSIMALKQGWLHELFLLGFKLASALIQGLAMSPSSKHFNHNALSHVMLSAAATTMLLHFWVA